MPRGWVTGPGAGQHYLKTTRDRGRRSLGGSVAFRPSHPEGGAQPILWDIPSRRVLLSVLRRPAKVAGNQCHVVQFYLFWFFTIVRPPNLLVTDILFSALSLSLPKLSEKIKYSSTSLPASSATQERGAWWGQFNDSQLRFLWELLGAIQRKRIYLLRLRCKGCILPHRVAGNMHFIKAPQVILIHSHMGTELRKVLLCWMW